MLSRDALAPALWTRADAAPVEWRVSPGLTPYPDALTFMDARAEAIAAGAAPELVWLLEHPPIYTAGTSAKDADLVEARFPVSGRAVAANTPIMGPDRGSPMSCST